MSNVLPNANADVNQKYIFKNGTSLGISNMHAGMVTKINFHEILFLKENQITIYEKIKSIDAKLRALDEKFDAVGENIRELKEALALVPDSDEVKKRNAETMAEIARIRMEKAKIIKNEN